MIKKHIPNSITCLNLFSGCVAVFLAFKGNYEGAIIAILLAAVFDFFDGFAARLLKAYSPMGKELDSLADMVSFGVAPGAIVFSLLSETNVCEWLPFLAFLIPVFSGLRLAKFNIDERQTTSFIGLPTPANAIFWAGLAFFLLHISDFQLLDSGSTHNYFQLFAGGRNSYVLFKNKEPFLEIQSNTVLVLNRLCGYLSRFRVKCFSHTNWMVYSFVGRHSIIYKAYDLKSTNQFSGL